MKKKIIHLLPNAHIDPVWLWTYQEGIAEALSTCRSLVNMMKKYPDLTFIRGEAWIYEQVIKYDEELFSEIKKLVIEKRWDIVGGNYIQSDTNLPETATFLKQFEVGKEFFTKHFNVDISAGWSADSFGQSRGLPEIYQASGMKYYAFGRPESWIYPMQRPLFKWRGASGAELLAFRIPFDWYAIERNGITKRIEDYLEQMGNWGMENTALFFGLGDHGGGTSERLIQDIHACQKKYNSDSVEIKFSTLHDFFAAAEAELKTLPADFLNIIDDEINFLQRGYYSSCAKVKFPYRHTEAKVRGSNNLTTFINNTLGKDTPSEFDKFWKTLMFNSFHDILPGTSIEEACNEQANQIKGLHYDADFVEFNSMLKLSKKIDTTVKPVPFDFPEAVPFLVFNPSASAYNGEIELEAGLDYRPIWSYEGRSSELPVELLDENNEAIPFQFIDVRNNFLSDLPWFKRVVFNSTIPAMGWKKFTLGYVENPVTKTAETTTKALNDYTICSKAYKVEADIATNSIKIYHQDKLLFDHNGISFVSSRDIWGSWGHIKEDPNAFMISDTVEKWQLTKVNVLENGPVRAKMYLLFAGKKSHVEVTVSVNDECDFVDMKLRVLWNERATRLSMQVASAKSIDYQVVGGICKRSEDVQGDVPGGRYLTWHKEQQSVAIASDCLYGYSNMKDKHFRATIIRGNLYATSGEVEAEELIHRVANDQGEHSCQFRISANAEKVLALSNALEFAPKSIMCDRHEGKLAKTGSLLEITPSQVDLLSANKVGNLLTLKLQLLDHKAVTATIKTPDFCDTIELKPYEIITYKKDIQ